MQSCYSLAMGYRSSASHLIRRLSFPCSQMAQLVLVWWPAIQSMVLKFEWDSDSFIENLLCLEELSPVVWEGTFF